MQESLAKGFRHGGSRNQRVSVSSSAGQLQIEIADDGSGFDPGMPNTGGHFGMDGMRERVPLLGGNVEVQSARIRERSSAHRCLCWKPTRHISESFCILVADDHPLFREGVVHSLAAESDFTVVGQTSSGDAGGARLPRQHHEMIRAVL